MLNINITTEFGDVQRMIDAMGKQARYAAAVALTKTAQKAQDDVKTEMRRVFDRPTPYTLNATRLIPATKANLEAQVWLKDRYGKAATKNTSFLFPEIFGGPRGRKGFEGRLLRSGLIRSNEYCVPAIGAPLDEAGNVSAATIRKILSQLGAANARDNSGYDSNVKKGKAQSAQSKRRQVIAGTFFIPDPKKSTLPRGIYQRKRLGSGWATRMVFKIVVGAPRYQARLKLFEIPASAGHSALKGQRLK